MFTVELHHWFIWNQGQITETTIDIPHAQHATLQGPKGQILRAVRDECGGVMIRFPAANVQSDKVLLRGPPEDVEKAKSLLLDLANDKVIYTGWNMYFTLFLMT